MINDLLTGGEVEKLMQDLVKCWHTRYEITIMTEDYQAGFYDFYPEDVKYITARPAYRLDESITAGLAEYPNENSNVDSTGCSDKYITAKSAMYSDGNLLKRCIYKVHKKIHTRWFDRQTAPGTFDIIFCMKEGRLMKQYFYLRASVRYGWVHTAYQSDDHPCGVYENDKHEIAVMKTYTGIICASEQIKKSIQETIGDPGNLLVRDDLNDVEDVLKTHFFREDRVTTE